MGRCQPQPPATAEQYLTLQHRVCVVCTQALQMAHRADRTIGRLDGVWRLRLTLHRCSNSQCPRYRRLCRPEEEGRWALPHGEFGFDVVALVGQLRYVQHRSIGEIHQELCTRGFIIAERTVTNLLTRYEELVTVRLTSHDALRERFLAQGHVILGLDGLKPDVGHEVLWVVRDCLSGEVIVARSLLSECGEEVGDLLREVKAALPVPITGVVSDGQRAFAVRSNRPCRACHINCVSTTICGKPRSRSRKPTATRKRGSKSMCAGFAPSSAPWNVPSRRRREP